MEKIVLPFCVVGLLLFWMAVIGLTTIYTHFFIVVGVFGPCVLGCLFYTAKFIWLVLLKKDENPFHDPVPVRYWFFGSVCLAIFGGLIVTSPLFYDDFSSSVTQFITLISLLMWGWIAVFGRGTIIDVFNT